MSRVTLFKVDRSEGPKKGLVSYCVRHPARFAAERGEEYVALDGSFAVATDSVPKHWTIEPIVFAPIPSEETRYWLKEAAGSGIGCRTCDWTHDSEKKIEAALSELEKAWAE